MSSTNSHDIYSLPVAAEITQHLRVIPDASGNAVVAGLADASIGTVVTFDGVGAVSVQTKRGKQWFVADGAITAGAKVYGAAAGKVSATNGAGSEVIGYAAEAAAANNDVIAVFCL